MKLYRGLKTDYLPFNSGELTSKWKKVLAVREKSKKYPEKLNSTILELKKLERGQRQFFTDNKEIATRYAKQEKGTLLTIDVPINEIIKNFHIEFQNYAKRRKRFELVYAVEGSTLDKNSKKWKLKVTKF